MCSAYSCAQMTFLILLWTILSAISDLFNDVVSYVILVLMTAPLIKTQIKYETTSPSISEITDSIDTSSGFSRASRLTLERC